MKKTTQYIVGGGLFAAIVAVLQLVGSAIRFGPFSISLVLIPIVLAAAMTEGLARRMEQELGHPCTLVLTGGLGRFVAPLCRREVVYDEDLLLRGLWKLYTANRPSADKP